MGEQVSAQDVSRAMKRLNASRKPISLGDLYFNVRPPDTISAHKPSISERIESSISQLFTKVGVDDRYARHAAGRVTKALTDLTPVGAATSAEDAKADYRRGNYAGAIGNGIAALLSVVPDGGATAGKVAHSIIAPLFHGSPHAFDKFLLEKIGTGEGAQAYGHGLYFAENRNVAEGYRDSLAGAQIIDRRGVPIRGREYEISDEIEKAARAAGYSRDKAADVATGWGHYVFNPSQKPDKVVRQVLDRHGLRSDSPGHLYEVSLNANPEDFLNWDAPLSGQSESVLRGLSSASLFKGAPPETLARMDQPGSFAYNNMVATRGGSYAGPRAVAPSLSQSGIPGIRYLDQGSRTAGQGTHNYVVFDPSIIDILNRY